MLAVIKIYYQPVHGPILPWYGCLLQFNYSFSFPTQQLPVFHDHEQCFRDFCTMYMSQCHWIHVLYFSRMDLLNCNFWKEKYAHFNQKRSARLLSNNMAPIHVPAKALSGCFLTLLPTQGIISHLIFFFYQQILCLSLITTGAEDLSYM